MAVNCFYVPAVPYIQVEIFIVTVRNVTVVKTETDRERIIKQKTEEYAVNGYKRTNQLH